MRLLVVLTTIERFTLLDEMTMLETVHAEVIASHHGDHVVMIQHFELGAGVKWVLNILTHDTEFGSSTCSEESGPLVSIEIFYLSAPDAFLNPLDFEVSEA